MSTYPTNDCVKNSSPSTSLKLKSSAQWKVESKRTRCTYTSSILVELEKQFHNNMYLPRTRRIYLAQYLNISETQVKVWFQNRRMKFKKEQKYSSPSPVLSNESCSSPASSSGSTDTTTINNIESEHSKIIDQNQHNIPVLLQTYPKTSYDLLKSDQHCQTKKDNAYSENKQENPYSNYYTPPYNNLDYCSGLEILAVESLLENGFIDMSRLFIH